jgi:uncharacterized repeat protein (TIGR03806 family)
VNRASSALCIAVAAAIFPAISGSCAAADEAPPVSPCVAFAKAGPATLKLDPIGVTQRASALVRVRGGFGKNYALDADGRLGRVDADVASTILVGGAGASGIDFAVTKGPTGLAQVYVARWVAAPAPSTSSTFELLRFASADGGMTFDAASKKVVFSERGGATLPGFTALAFSREGFLFVAYASQDAPPAGSSSGAVLRLDVSGETAVFPPDNPRGAAGMVTGVWASGVHQPLGLDVDPETGDLWLTDYAKQDDATLVHRIMRGGITDLKPALVLPAPEKRAASTGGHVYRGRLVPDLVGKYVYAAPNGVLVAVDAYGPSGPMQATKLVLGADGPIGRGDDGELVVAPASGGFARVVDGGPPSPAPTSLLATKCWDATAKAGVPVGAIPYDVTTPLWSDGATKERFVVVPSGAKITARADGDLLFPVGTVAVKTFAVDGKRIETRLLVQHDVEDWVGYSYAWKEDGSDAELVRGNRIASLAGGKSWYFPSTTDCSACHTPAAGYTLGLEAKQLVGRGTALAQLDGKLSTPIDHASLATLVAVDAPPPATAEARARSYLHSNCSICHREGSATGTFVDLDLRLETPLAKTGLCKEAQAGTLGLATGARIVVPHDPAGSVIVARMRVLDERRMPKLASRVVDEAGVAAVEAWVRDLASCP